MTVRTHAQLLALFADNTGGNITAGNMRDFVDTFFGTQIVYVDAELFAATSGAGRPTQAQIGATAYWAFAVNDAFWPHLTLPKDLDPSKDILINVDWAPVLAESSKTCTWQLEYFVTGSTGETLDTVDATLTAVDEAVLTTQWQEEQTVFTIPAADVTDDDHEIHMKLTRLASTTDPTTVGVHHVWATVETLRAGG